MAILSKIRFKYSIMLDMAVLVILIVMESLLHEASHVLAVITLGGEVDAIVINAFDPEQSYVAYRIVYSDYSELYQAIIKLLPHLLLGIIGFYLVHKGISRIKLAGKDAGDKYTYLLISLLYLGIGIGWFLPFRYLNLRSYHQFDIPQATLHLSNFAHLCLPERALFLSNLPAEFQMRLLIFGLIGWSGMIYGGLWRTKPGERILAGLGAIYISITSVRYNTRFEERSSIVLTEIQNREGHRKTGKAMSLMFGLSLIVVLAAGTLGGMYAPGTAIASPPQPGQIEPEAGTWQTWVLESGSQLRLAAPPDEQKTQEEINAVKEIVEKRDEAALGQIAFWHTGPAVYRWNEMAVNEALKTNMGTPAAARMLALLNVAMYDATIAAWDSKYTYDRARPSEVDPSVATVIPNPNSPSYPAEHAVMAGAASEILAYLFPDSAAAFREKAEEAGQSFVLAGVQYPSDVDAGLELGRQVAALVIERARQDGFDAKWEGSTPSEPGHWTGENPAVPMAGTWKTWVLSSGSEFRPGPPFAYDSAEMAAELAELKDLKLTPKMTADAYFTEYAAGGTRNFWYWNEQTGQKLLEYRLDDNLPRAARVYALVSIAYYDSFVACWDAKYAYWAMRPFQVDPTFQPLFKTPNHPSYPSAHACLSVATAETLAHLFPRDAEAIRDQAQVFLDSRIWAGIHFRSDVEAGEALGRAVAQKVIEHAQKDGAQ